MVKKYKYVYDKRTGHFIKKLYEDDSNSNSNVTTDDSTTNKDNTNTENKTESASSSYKSVMSDETIQKIDALKQDKDNKFNDAMKTLNKLLEEAKANAASSTVLKYIYDPASVDSTVLSIQKKINELKKQYAMDLYNIENQRLALLQQLANVTNESYYRIPDKYKNLNESNLHTAKIYMKDLVVSDDDHILKGMADFKRAFKDTNLLYGKDKTGYFVVAIDDDDVSAMFDTLEETGYLRDQIIDTVLPQLLDRRNMIQ